MPDGKILQAIVYGNKIVIYDPKLNTFQNAPSPPFNMNESTWVKLPDNSILYIGTNSNYSVRYIPSANKWIMDASCPISLYDPFGYETGPGFLLPNGKVFFIGAWGQTAYYIPSGDSTKGSWSIGAKIPLGLSAPDASASMMKNGNILCALSPIPTFSNHFQAPTYFFEFDYTKDSFIQIKAPTDSISMYMACYNTNMLNLPDGNILFSSLESSNYYIYQPDGVELENGKPIIKEIVQINCDSFLATGFFI